MNKQDSPQQRSTLLGIAFLAVALAVNTSSVGLGAFKFGQSLDEILASDLNRGVVLAGQVVCALAGLLLLLGKVRLPKHLNLLGSAALLVPIGLGFFWTAQSKGYLLPELAATQIAELERMNASESVHLNLTPRFKRLGQSAMNMRLPSAGGAKYFTDNVRVVDLKARVDVPHAVLENFDTRVYHWEVEASSEERLVAREDLDLMRPLLDVVDYFESNKFGFVGGDFLGDEENGYDYSQWRVEGYFKGVARLTSGEVAKVKGKLYTTWQLSADSDPANNEHMNDADRWFISEFHFSSFEVMTSPFRYFQEVLGDVVEDGEALAEARRNHVRRRLEVMLADYLVDDSKWPTPSPHWDYRGAWIMPSVSVVDVDGDGWDDFYALEQEGDPQFFRNQGDGTFVDETDQRGLRIQGPSEWGSTTNAALFADFDNDGDPDLFLARSLEPSRYLLNEGGVFSDATDRIPGGDVYWGSTASASDYDRDGELDLYIGTYAAQAVAKDYNRTIKGVIEKGAILADYLPADQAETLYHMAFESMEHSIHDRVGPPNRLMRNTGGRFTVVEDTPLTLYRNTFQATWGDVDIDGNPDLYAANDFALNNMFRNMGDGTFVDVTGPTESGDVGFGMGVSIGDFDADGDQDLYVSNMFSKAGSRIIPRVTGIDRRFLGMASGNSLFAWQDGKFKKSSSKDDSMMKVEIGGWSWGSQFLDVDNDGWLDIYTLNGFYSAPKFFRDGVDL